MSHDQGSPKRGGSFDSWFRNKNFQIYDSWFGISGNQPESLSDFRPFLEWGSRSIPRVENIFKNGFCVPNPK